MTFWKRFRSFMSTLDFEDVRKDIADDLKKLSFVLGGLGLLAVVPDLSGIFVQLPKIVGIDATAVQTSDWVKLALFGSAAFTYLTQALMRVKVRSDLKKDPVEVATLITPVSNIPAICHDNSRHRIAVSGIVDGGQNHRQNSPKTANTKNPKRKFR